MFFGIIFLLIVLADKCQHSDLRAGVLFCAGIEALIELGIAAVYIN